MRIMTSSKLLHSCTPVDDCSRAALDWGETLSASLGAAINFTVNFSIISPKPFKYSVSIERDNMKREGREATV